MVPPSSRDKCSPEASQSQCLGVHGLYDIRSLSDGQKYKFEIKKKVLKNGLAKTRSMVCTYMECERKRNTKGGHLAC